MPTGKKLKAFITIHRVDILLISETHLSKKSNNKIPEYTIYDTKHLMGRPAHGGTAIIIKNSLKHRELGKCVEKHVQATRIQIEDFCGLTTISAIYCPPKHKV